MKSGLEIAQEADLQPIADIARRRRAVPGRAGALRTLSRQGGALGPRPARGRGRTASSSSRRRSRRRRPARARRRRPCRSRRVSGRSGSGSRCACASPRWGRCSGSRAAGTEAGTRRSCRWRRSTSTSTATSTRSPPRTTCSPPRSTRRSSTATRCDIDPQTITWPRTLDVNDRELRYTVVGLGGKAHGMPAREPVRHHGGVRDHGGVRARERSPGSAQPGSAGSSSRTTARASPSPPRT